MPPTASHTRGTSVPAPPLRPGAAMLPTAASAASNAANAASKLSSSLAKASVSAARRPPSSLASALTLSLVCLASKAFLRTTASVRVTGREHLYSALGIGGMGEVPWDKRRGVITIANHNSAVDDPMMWSLLPLSTYSPVARPSYTCANNRWTLGASDIMFTNKTLSKFFSLGQVIETVRGGGIYQEGVEEAIQKIEEGGWVHLFPEGRVNQEKSNPDGGLHRFKWGVGRIIMDSAVMPEIIPMWISGFDQIMNERRGFPRFLPRPGASVSITIGPSITPRIAPMVDAWRASLSTTASASVSATPSPSAAAAIEAVKPAPQEPHLHGEHPHADYMRGEFDPDEAARREITGVLQESVRALGEAVEAEEGRFERGTWSQSRRREGIEAGLR